MEGDEKIRITPRRVRLLLTYSCNAKCFYCHNEGQAMPEKTLINHVFVKNLLEMVDIHEIVLSGGEPTMNSDVVNIAKVIRQSGDIRLSITTNGSNTETLCRLGDYLDKVRVSIDTPDPEKYRQIKGLDIEKPLESLQQAKSRGIKVRINCPIASVSEALDMAEFGERTKTEIRFFELLEPGFCRPETTIENFKEKLKDKGYVVQEGGEFAEVMRKKDHSVSLARVTCMNAARLEDDEKAREFCRKRMDMFITPSGKIKPCMHDSREIDIFSSVMRKDKRGLEEKLREFDDRFGVGACRTSVSHNRINVF